MERGEGGEDEKQLLVASALDEDEENEYDTGQDDSSTSSEECLTSPKPKSAELPRVDGGECNSSNTNTNNISKNNNNGDDGDGDDDLWGNVTDLDDEQVTMTTRLKRIETLVVLSCVLGVAVNQLLAAHNLRKLTREAPAPHALFANVSYLDVYDGELNTVIEEFLRHEVTVTLYYAPWDATSRESLRTFNEVAMVFRDVRFVAINCWQNSACSKYYQFKFYPSLSVYVRGQGSIQYPIYSSLAKDYLVTFLHNVINPITVVSSDYEWYVLRSRHYAVVTVPQQYYRFGYNLALESLRKDPRQRVGYAVLGRGGGDVIRFHLWNETLTYNESDNPTVSSVSKWVYSKFHEPVGYLMNSGYKSNQIAKLANTTKAFLIVKTTPNSSMNLNLHMLALQFYSCRETYDSHTKHVLLSLLVGSEDTSVDCQRPPFIFECQSTSTTCSARSPANVSFMANWATRVTEMCLHFEALWLKRFEVERICQTHRIRPDGAKDPKGLLWGLGCGKEHLFSFLTLDAALYDTLYPLEAPAMIFDVEEDIKYLLPHSQFTARGIEFFVARYVTKLRDRLTKSMSVVRHNLFGEEPKRFIPPSEEKAANEEQDVEYRNTRVSIDSSAAESPAAVSPTAAAISESTLRDTIIFFYTDWCGFCKSVAANFHRVARFFKETPIAFRTVDAEGTRFEDVRYSPDSFPQVVFFPRNSSDSIRYSGSWRPQCLTRFILNHCSEDVLQLL